MTKRYKNRKHGIKHGKKTKTKKRGGKVPEDVRARLATEAENIAELTHHNNIAELTQTMANIAPTFILKSRQYINFINRVTMSYEYKHKNIPSVLLNLITQIHDVLERVNHLLRFHNEPAFLEAELVRNGYNGIVTYKLTLTNMEDIEDKMEDIKDKM